MTKRVPAHNLDDDEFGDDDIDPATGMTGAEYAAAAEEAYAHRDEWDSLEEVEFTVDPNVRSVVSVRFRPGEVGIVERAANAAGVPFSTFIRNAALNAATALDVEAARDALRSAREELDRVLRTLDGRPAVAPEAKPTRTTAKAPETKVAPEKAASRSKAAAARGARAKSAGGATTPGKGRRKAA